MQSLRVYLWVLSRLWQRSRKKQGSKQQRCVVKTDTQKSIFSAAAKVKMTAAACWTAAQRKTKACHLKGTQEETNFIDTHCSSSTKLQSHFLWVSQEKYEWLFCIANSDCFCAHRFAKPEKKNKKPVHLFLYPFTPVIRCGKSCPSTSWMSTGSGYCTTHCQCGPRDRTMPLITQLPALQPSRGREATTGGFKYPCCHQGAQTADGVIGVRPVCMCKMRPGSKSLMPPHWFVIAQLWLQDVQGGQTITPPQLFDPWQLKTWPSSWIWGTAVDISPSWQKIMPGHWPTWTASGATDEPGHHC